MNPRNYAFVGGIIMLVMGAVALVFPGRADILPALSLESSYGLFLGLFPMNVLNKLALIVVGLAGIACARAPGRSLPFSIFWSRFVFFAMGILAILGMFPATSTLGGYWPLFRGEVWAHAIFALIGAYYGFTLTSKVPQSPVGPHPARESLAH